MEKNELKLSELPHYMDGLKPQPSPPVLTSRELTELIDELICLRMQAPAIYLSNITKERIEVVKRKIADALKDLDHRSGVAFFGRNDL